MELSVRKSHLLHELQLCQGIVERKNTIPILSNVLLETDGDDGVDLLATDLDVTLRTRCDASIGRAGSVTVPAKKLFEIVRNLPETDILIREESKGSVTVEAESFHSKLQTLPREDFPTLPEVGDAGVVTIDRAVLRGMVTKTSFAITGGGYAVLSQRRAVRREERGDEPDRDGWTPLGPGKCRPRGRGAAGWRVECDPPQEDTERG